MRKKNRERIWGLYNYTLYSYIVMLSYDIFFAFVLVSHLFHFRGSQSFSLSFFFVHGVLLMAHIRYVDDDDDDDGYEH